MHIEIKSDIVFSLFNFHITNTLLTEWLALIVLLVIGIFIKKIVVLKPTSRVQIVFEEAITFFDGLATDIFGKSSVRPQALLLTLVLFFFILIPNWLGLLPGVGALLIREGERMVPLFRSPNSDLTLPLTLALISFCVTQYYGFAHLKLGYLKKFFNFKSAIGFFMGILELLSEFTKILSLSFRLFGNILAGEIIILLALFFIPFVVPLPLLFFETFVGVIQAFIFSVLTAVFIKTAVSTDH